MPIYIGNNLVNKLIVGSTTTFSPADFTNVQYWWRADLGVTESGGAVTQWEDQINSYQLVVLGGSPTLTTDANLNGADVIDFDGNDGLYATTTLASRTGDFTLLGVFYNNNANVDDSIFGVNNVPIQQRTQFQITNEDASGGDLRWVTRWFGDTAGYEAIQLEVPGTNGAKAVKGRYDASAGKVYGAVNTLTESGPATTGRTNEPFDSTNTFAAGGWAQGTGGGVYDNRYFIGTIAEMVMIYDTPSSDEMNSWKDYVNNRYGTLIS